MERGIKALTVAVTAIVTAQMVADAIGYPDKKREVKKCKQKKQCP